MYYFFSLHEVQILKTGQYELQFNQQYPFGCNVKTNEKCKEWIDLIRTSVMNEIDLLYYALYGEPPHEENITAWRNMAKDDLVNLQSSMLIEKKDDRDELVNQVNTYSRQKNEVLFWSTLMQTCGLILIQFGIVLELIWLKE